MTNIRDKIFPQETMIRLAHKVKISIEIWKVGSSMLDYYYHIWKIRELENTIMLDIKKRLGEDLR